MITQEQEGRLTVTVEEAAKLLGIGRKHAYEMAKQGKLPVIRLGGRILISKAALLKMVADVKPVS